MHREHHHSGLNQEALDRADPKRRSLSTALLIAPWADLVAASGKTMAAVASDQESGAHRESVHRLSKDERRILTWAATAPSGHNAQPWTVHIAGPGHWSISISRRRRLPAVDPDDREASLSIGAFLENVIVSAAAMGYRVEYRVVGQASIDRPLIDLRLYRAAPVDYPLTRLARRRTVRNGYANDPIRSDDLRNILDDGSSMRYLSRGTPQARYLAEATIATNRKQAYRDPAQEELADWIRWSKAEQARYRNGLTPKSMEIEGFVGWYVGHFYDRASVLTKDFRERGVQQAIERVRQGAGWMVMTGGDTVAEWVETGRAFQRMWLGLRERGIAIHPMTQLLEETTDIAQVTRALSISQTPQFILRVGYVRDYPDPVSPRMPAEWFTTKV
jgi:nitroreductase